MNPWAQIDQLATEAHGLEGFCRVHGWRLLPSSGAGYIAATSDRWLKPEERTVRAPTAKALQEAVRERVRLAVEREKAKTWGPTR